MQRRLFTIYTKLENDRFKGPEMQEIDDTR